jgi:Asp-tRNA(Asn)/Glu-tRNA(Gln) amidotransferase A subunit family amidase
MRLGSLLAACLLAAAPALVSAQTSAEAETAAAIARIETLNPQLNAVIAVDPEALDRNPCGS